MEGGDEGAGKSGGLGSGSLVVLYYFGGLRKEMES